MPDFSVTIDPTQERNARLELQSRIEGAVSLLDNPVEILASGTTLTVHLSDALPTEEIQAVIRTLANLVGRPESGIIGAVQVTPENTDGLQRTYSQ